MLPDTYLIIDKTVSGDECAQHLITACERGIRLIRLRSAGQTPTEYLAFIQLLLPLAKQHGAFVMVDGVDYLSLGADGVHLTSAQLLAAPQRPIDRYKVCAASAHDLSQLQHAQQLGLDFVTLSPVKKTATHPSAEPLGWPCFSSLAKQVHIPVFALGGLTLADREEAKQWGAYGIAGIRHCYAG